MDSATNTTLPKNETSATEIGSSLHEEKTNTNSSPSTATQENCDKKNITETPDIASSAQAKPADVKEIVTKSDSEDINLQMESSDDDMFGGSNTESVAKLDKAKEPLMTKTSEKYFSDIESSDDSIAYETKSKAEGLKEADSTIEELETTPIDKEDDGHNEATKKKDLELEPVESDEEYFEDCLPLGAVDPVSDEEICEVDETIKDKSSPTQLLDEKDKEPKTENTAVSLDDSLQDSEEKLIEVGERITNAADSKDNQLTELDAGKSTNNLIDDSQAPPSVVESIPAVDTIKRAEKDHEQDEVGSDPKESIDLERKDNTETPEKTEQSLKRIDKESSVNIPSQSPGDEGLESPVLDDKVITQEESNPIKGSLESTSPSIEEGSSKKTQEIVEVNSAETLISAEQEPNEDNQNLSTVSEESLKLVEAVEDVATTVVEQKEPSTPETKAIDDDDAITEAHKTSDNTKTISAISVDESTSINARQSDDKSLKTTEESLRSSEISATSLPEVPENSVHENDESTDDTNKVEEVQTSMDVPELPKEDTSSEDIEMVAVVSEENTQPPTEKSEIEQEVRKVDSNDINEGAEKDKESNLPETDSAIKTDVSKTNEIVPEVVSKSPQTAESHESNTEIASDSLQSDGLNSEEVAANVESVGEPLEAQKEDPTIATNDSDKPGQAEKDELLAKEEDVVEIVVCTEKDSSDIPSSGKTGETLAEPNVSEENLTSTPKDTIDSNESIVTAEVVETPEVQAEVVVEKTIDIPSQTEKNNTQPETAQEPAVASTKPTKETETEPEIIEIDDDDDEEVTKKQEVLVEKISQPEEKASSPQTKEQAEPSSIPLTANESEKPIEEPKPTLLDSNKPPVEGEKSSDKETTSNQLSNDDDDEEPLLMIDTSHKEDNEVDDNNYNDTETATSAPSTDSSSESSLEVFHDKECVNYECKRGSKNYFRATMFTLNYFKISKKRSKVQFVCEDCYDRALGSYEALCKTLKQKQPLLHGNTFECPEFVEIIDSSDEEESDAGEDKGKDENELPKETIQMLEAELEGTIRKVMQNVDIQNQLSWTKQILTQRLNNLQEDASFVTDQLRMLQKKADSMHNSLYQCPKIKLRQLTPLDLNSGRMYNPESDNTANSSLPPVGEVKRTSIRLNEPYYAVKNKAIASWVPCKVIEEVESYPGYSKQPKNYKIKFTKSKYPMLKTVSAKHMAFFDAPKVRLPIGSRVIAYFDATSLSRGKEKMLIPSAFYPGIIAEPLKESNKFRYLVFYDDGYFQYVNHKDVRLVCQASENVWEDVHHQSREFIHNYLTQCAVNRPMVQTSKGQSMLVDYNGKWIYARVIDVDCSLVQMLFEGQSRSEWIYRGSTRLGPVYKESNNLSQKNTLNATRRRTEPFIRYINGDDSASTQQAQESEEPQQKSGEPRSVAKKSVSRTDQNSNTNTGTSAQPIPAVRHLNNSVIFVDDDNKPKGKVVYYTARKNLPPRDYVPHVCGPSCPFNVTHNLSFYSPLAKPLLSGWERQVFRQKAKKFIVYRGPCGKRMRNIEELHRYLRVTENELNVDNFDFSSETNCLAEYVLEKCLVNKKDISCGKEKMPIPCVNYYDESMPPACEYSAERIPTAGVPLNLDEEFMCGCDCEDDCSDKTKCACWELTYAGAKYGMPTVPTEMVGYQYKRLYDHVPTGIYECNSRCKCQANCVNRVVQQPLQSKLQVFKTSNRGWGLRCINDVPRGSFICVYAGQLLTEQVANEGGLDAGDEYFAELDYIEVAEQIKEGYESDVHEPDDDEELYNPDRDDDDFDFRAPSDSGKDKEFTTRLRARRSTKNSSDAEHDSQERQTISFEPNKTMDTSNDPTSEKPTIRKLFGKDECCYVMDAKVRGNLGRYFNHSCSPNLFVQNVFVDTHDLRFPWVAFFASTHIRAGTELTWNYNYEVGVVPGKVLYCQCGAPNCRQRLL